jgi:hypothetical protein
MENKLNLPKINEIPSEKLYKLMEETDEVLVVLVNPKGNKGSISFTSNIENGKKSYFCICQDVKETWTVDLWIEFPEPILKKDNHGK